MYGDCELPPEVVDVNGRKVEMLKVVERFDIEVA